MDNGPNFPDPEKFEDGEILPKQNWIYSPKYLLNASYPMFVSGSAYVLPVATINCLYEVSYKKSLQLIHSANPKSRPVGIIVFTRCLSVRPSPLFKSRKTKLQKTMFTTGVTMGLAEWIIDDTCLVKIVFICHITITTAYWPTRPRTNRWLLLSRMMSLRMFTKVNYTAMLWTGPGRSLKKFIICYVMLR